MRARDFGLIHSLDELQIMAEKLLADGKMVAFDLETSYSTPKPVAKRALDVTHPDQFVCGFSITNDPGWARYVPLRHDNFAGNLDPVSAWETIRPVLEQLEVLSHHKKFEDKNLRMLAIKGQARAPIVTKIGHDTMLAAYVLGRFQRVGLKELSQGILHYDQAEFSSLFGDAVLVFHKDGSPPTVSKAKVEKQRFSALDPTSTSVLNYVCDDVSCMLELHPILQNLLAHEPDKRRFIYGVELGISELMADVEIFGTGVDWEPMERHRALYKPFAARMEKAVKDGFAALVKDPEAREKVAGLNLASAPQMQKLLYEDIGWKATRFSAKTNKPSADKIALESLSRRYQPVKRLLQMREMNNLGIRHETWLDEFRESYDQRVHANYSQVRVVSGRFAADKPAIQQLPKHWYWDIRFPGEEVEDVKASSKNGERYWEGWFRKYIVAAPGNYLLTFDYSQVELRVLAGVSKEARLLQAFDQDEDVHSVTTAQMLGIPLEDVDPDKRQIGKTLNFALLYGMGVKSLSDRLAVPLERGQELYGSYFQQFSSIDSWVTKTKRDGLREGYVETFFGRRVPLWDLQSDKEGVRKKAERVAVNGPIQGGAADYMKIAMIRVVKMLRREGLWNNGVMITMNQHDSLVFEVSNEIDPNWLREKLITEVVFPVKGFPKIVADWEIGLSWGASTKWAADAQAHFDGQTWVVDGAEPALSASEAFGDDYEVDWGEPDEDDEEVIEVEDEGVLTIVVECSAVPTKARLNEFLALVRATPGEYALELVLDGRPVPLTLTTSLTPSDSGRVSLALGGAQVSEEVRARDLDAAIAGLSF
jgi:DNA polymerase-1